jgi:methyltransferase-like protein/protein-L-isoaspartate O-methyltransferase
MTENNPYDQIPYQSYPFAQTHPNRLATLATLHGLQPAPVTHCRVLEVGCGDGANLIPMALGLPDSQFIGFDLAAQPVQRGQETIATLGLTNIELRQADLLEFTDEPFDYIIAHGLYAWVPAVVQDGLLALCQRLLKPHGIAYISYNAYPGCHLRELVREMMLFHLRGTDDPQQRIKQGIALLKFLLSQYPSEEKAREDIYGSLLTEQFNLLSHPSRREIVYHDYLSPAYRPVYFFQFAAHAEHHGLQYLTEADYSDTQDVHFPPAVRAALAQFDDEHIVHREQYLDFFKGRAFRQTLLCRADLKLQRAIQPRQLTNFYLSAKIEEISEPLALTDKVVVTFTGPQGAQLQTDFPLAKAALLVLKEAWPRPLAWAELEAAAVARLTASQNASVTAEEIAVLPEILWAAYGSAVVELSLHRPAMQLEVTPRPLASPLARWQAHRGIVITNLLHLGVVLDDELSRQLLPLMDGTRDHVALQAALTEVMTPHLPLTKPDGSVLAERAGLAQWIAETLEENLQKSAQLALLTG